MRISELVHMPDLLIRQQLFQITVGQVAYGITAIGAHGLRICENRMEEIMKKQIGKSYAFTIVVLFLVFVSFLVTVTGSAAKSSTSSQETRLIPMEDFFRNPEKTNFKLSPDGSISPI